MAKKKIPAKLQLWIDARKRFHLSHAHIQMARELGMNPKKFGSLANYKQEKWKSPLPLFIEEYYFKRFGKTRPDQVRSLEETLIDRPRVKNVPSTPHHAKADQGEGATARSTPFPSSPSSRSTDSE